MNDIPIAVISGASLGALRNGRYATRSIITFSEPDASMLTTSTPPIPAMITSVDDLELIPSQAQIDTATNEPIMNTSPWAKLISSMIP
jgi:hypothetical protein